MKRFLLAGHSYHSSQDISSLSSGDSDGRAAPVEDEAFQQAGVL